MAGTVITVLPMVDPLRDLPALLHRGDRHPGTEGLMTAARGCFRRRGRRRGRRSTCSRSTSAGRSSPQASSTAPARVHSFVVELDARRRGAGARSRAALRARAQGGRRGRRRVAARSAPSGSAAAARSTPARGVLIAPPHLPGWRDVPVTALARAGVRAARPRSRTTRPRRPPASTASAPAPGRGTWST